MHGPHFRGRHAPQILLKAQNNDVDLSLKAHAHTLLLFYPPPPCLSKAVEWIRI